MTDEEATALNWLDVIPCDLHSFANLIGILELSPEVKKIVLCSELITALIARLRSLLNVLAKLQQRTVEMQDAELAVREMKELMKGLVVTAFNLRTSLEHFGQEQFLCQLIRNRKLVECIQRAHDGVDDFVFEVQRSRVQDEFTQCAADLGLEVSVMDRDDVYWRDQVNAAGQALQREIDAHSLEAHDPTACEQRAACRLVADLLDPELSCKAASMLALETQRSRLLQTYDLLIDVVRIAMPAPPANEVRVQPWFLPSDSIRLLERIGSGGCGEVWRGSLDMTTAIVVKRLLVNERDSVELAHMRKTAHEREFRVWQQLNHPHILQFYGATAFGADCSIVSELAVKGRLYDYWLSPTGSTDPLLKAQLWRLLFEAALGLQYMHSKGFVHGDLKCDNIFVGDDWKAKVADFGLSFMNGDCKSVSCTEAASWLAPECLAEVSKRARSFATDVFMFGMCIVEAVCGRPPWGSSPDVSVRRFLKNGKLPYIIKHFAPAVQTLVNAMCAYEPADRISMDEVVERLKLLDEMRDPRHLEVQPLVQTM